MEKEFLSKCKYFFIITCDEERLHIQKFPIIYINKHCVYYRINGSDNLECIGLDYVHDDISEIDLAGLSRFSRRYLWKAPDDFQEKNSWYMEQAKNRKQMEALEKAKKDYEYSIRNLEAAEKKYKEIQAAINGDKSGV